MKRIRFAPEAEDELAAAAKWYEARRPGLGVELVAVVDAALEKIVANPLTLELPHALDQLLARGDGRSIVSVEDPCWQLVSGVLEGVPSHFEPLSVEVSSSGLLEDGPLSCSARCETSVALATALDAFLSRHARPRSSPRRRGPDDPAKLGGP